MMNEEHRMSSLIMYPTTRPAAVSLQSPSVWQRTVLPLIQIADVLRGLNGTVLTDEVVDGDLTALLAV
jgi:hypothetical protein